MIRRFLTALISLTLAASFVFARNVRTARTPAQSVANRVARLTTLLMLNPGQVTEATTIFTTEQSAPANAAADMKTAGTALQIAIQANNTADITTADAAFYALLNPAQQAQYTQLGGLREAGGGFGPRDRRR